jgi:hypothetical protein
LTEQFKYAVLVLGIQFWFVKAFGRGLACGEALRDLASIEECLK